MNALGTLNQNFICLENDCELFAEHSITCQDGQPLGYYLNNDGVYQTCFDYCKFCNGPGNVDNHNCRECKDGYRLLNDFENDMNCYVDCPHYYYWDQDNVYHCTENEECPTEYNFLILEKKKCIDHCEKDNIYKYEYHHTCLPYIVNETTYIEEQIPKTTYIENVKPETTQIEKIKPETSYINNIKLEKSSIGITETEKPEAIPEKDLFNCLNQNKLINKCYTKDNYNNSQKYNIITETILSSYSSNSMKSLVLEGEKGLIYQITSSKNERELLNNDILLDDYNLPIIDLGECEDLLRQEYNIAEEDSLIIVKKENSANKSSEKNIEYEIFEPYNKTKLNMSICSQVEINMYVKLELSEEMRSFAEEMEALGYNIFDINDRFYTDYCAKFTTKDKTDMLLQDRIDYIYNNIDSQCQSNCRFLNYVSGSKYINCTCNVEREKNVEVKYIDKLNSKTVLQSFYYVLKYSNYKILKCYKLVFVSTVLSKNKGSIFIFILFILYCICLLVYMKKGIKPLKLGIEDFLKEFIDDDGKINIYKSTLFFPPPKNLRSSLKGKERKEGKEPKQKDSTKTLKQFHNERVAKFDDKEPQRLNSKSQFFKEKKKERKYSSSKDIIHSQKNSTKERKSKFRIRETNSEIKLEEKQDQKNFDDFELNELEYPDAVKYDKRNWLKTYWGLLKREHRIIFTFFIFNDYNMFVVKMSKFIFLLATDMAMNFFFFSDSTMHKIFLDYGKYNFVQQIPQILYSTVVSQIIEVFLCFLSLTDTHIYEIKQLELNERNKKVIMDIFKCIEIKLFFYFLFAFICFLGYWYIVACFCAVYTNTQIIFIKDSLMSSLMSFLYPFILYTIPSAFRKCSIRCKNNKCLYKFSEIIPFF